MERRHDYFFKNLVLLLEVHNVMLGQILTPKSKRRKTWSYLVHSNRCVRWNALTPVANGANTIRHGLNSNLGISQAVNLTARIDLAETDQHGHPTNIVERLLIPDLWPKFNDQCLPFTAPPLCLPSSCLHPTRCGCWHSPASSFASSWASSASESRL